MTKAFSDFSWIGQLHKPSCCGEKEMMNVYFDAAAHFRPWVYEEMNNVLLNTICE
jgi:hypothetical protein